VSLALKSPAELIGRMELSPSDTVLLVDAPEALERVLSGARPGTGWLESVPAERLSRVKEEFDVVVLWREDRAGSRALLASALRRARAAGSVWVVTAMRKVQGPRTPAAHRLDRRDLEKAFAGSGLVLDREARFSSWHMGYRFRRAPAARAGGEERYST
jgi:hypothetical protein